MDRACEVARRALDLGAAVRPARCAEYARTIRMQPGCFDRLAVVRDRHGCAVVHSGSPSRIGSPSLISLTSLSVRTHAADSPGCAAQAAPLRAAAHPRRVRHRRHRPACQDGQRQQQARLVLQVDRRRRAHRCDRPVHRTRAELGPRWRQCRPRERTHGRSGWPPRDCGEARHRGRHSGGERGDLVGGRGRGGGRRPSHLLGPGRRPPTRRGLREIDGMPVVEEPSRLVRQLLALARGLLSLGRLRTAGARAAFAAALSGGLGCPGFPRAAGRRPRPDVGPRKDRRSGAAREIS